MARINKGILGPVEGTVGTVVGANWKGINYIRSKSGPKKTSSIEQLDHQLKFSVVVSFVASMTSLLQQTFHKYAVKMSEVNAAFAYNYGNALTGVSPDYEIDYPKALVSRGELPNGITPAATETAGGLHFTWTDNTGAGTALATDMVVLVAFCPNLNTTSYSIGSAARDAASAVLDVTGFAGETIHTWMAFISADEKEASNSTYTGTLSVS